MKIRQIHSLRWRSAKRWTALACLCLLGITLVAQTLHLHPNELANTDFKHCAVCQLAHAPATVASLGHISFGLTTLAALSLAAHPHLKPVLASFSLFSRPPPLA